MIEILSPRPYILLLLITSHIECNYTSKAPRVIITSSTPEILMKPLVQFGPNLAGMVLGWLNIRQPRPPIEMAVMTKNSVR